MPVHDDSPASVLPTSSDREPRWRFLRTPWWLAGHVIVVVAVVSFASLGLWQLDRLEERRAYNEAFASQMDQEPTGLGDIDPLLEQGQDAAAFRRVEVAGTFDPSDEVLLSTRSMDGTPGHHVLTPLETTAHGTVLVDRGWVPLELGSRPPPVEEVPPPEGETTVTGVLFSSVEARRAGAQDGRGDALEFMSDVDVQRFAMSVQGAVYPLYILAQDIEGADPGVSPAYGALPETDEGNHFSYAMQWLIFAGVVGIGYPVLLRHQAGSGRHDEESEDAPEEITVA